MGLQKGRHIKAVVLKLWHKGRVRAVN